MNIGGFVKGKDCVGGISGHGHSYKGSFMMDSKTTYGSIAGKLENIEIK